LKIVAEYLCPRGFVVVSGGNKIIKQMNELEKNKQT